PDRDSSDGLLKTLCRCCHLVLVSGNIVCLLAQMVPPVSKMRPPLLSLPLSPCAPPPLMRYTCSCLNIASPFFCSSSCHSSAPPLSPFLSLHELSGPGAEGPRAGNNSPSAVQLRAITSRTPVCRSLKRESGGALGAQWVERDED
ncbi:hypothetical protein KUCAC02_027336, partial [Chaenocephalus aceratus]